MTSVAEVSLEEGAKYPQVSGQAERWVLEGQTGIRMKSEPKDENREGGTGQTGHVGPCGSLPVRSFGFYSRLRKGPAEGLEKSDAIVSMVLKGAVGCRN